MKQLKSLASSLGIGSDGENAQNTSASPENSALASLMSALSQNGNSNSNPPANLPDMNSIMKLQKIFSSFSKEDDNIRLLRALRPHLKEQNRKKVDDAIKIMQLISVLPMIKEAGLFGGDLF